MVEASNGSVRRECLSQHWLTSIPKSQCARASNVTRLPPTSASGCPLSSNGQELSQTLSQHPRALVSAYEREMTEGLAIPRVPLEL